MIQTQIANVEQAAAWDGAEGSSWASDWELYDQGVRAYRAHLVDVAAITDGEHVLDIGCGNGQSSRDAASATPSGSVLGIDLSSAMLARARELTAAEGLTNATYVQGDAQVHPFDEGAFDVAISRFGAMFFDDKAAAFANIARAVRPGGRLVLVAWQSMADNEQFRTVFGALAAGRDLPKPPPGAPSPFGLADPELGRAWLEGAGFVDVVHESVRDTFCAGATADDAYNFFRRSPIGINLLGGLDEEARGRALDALRAGMQAHDTGDGVLFDSAVWFITARRP